LFRSEFYGLVNTAIVLDNREKNLPRKHVSRDVHSRLAPNNPMPFPPAFPLVYKVCRKLRYDVCRPPQLKLVLRCLIKHSTTTKFFKFQRSEVVQPPPAPEQQQAQAYSAKAEELYLVPPTISLQLPCAFLKSLTFSSLEQSLLC
jgi:hypothetical protein